MNLPFVMDFVSCGLNHCVVVNSGMNKVFGWGSNAFKQLSPFEGKKYIIQPVELNLVYASGDYTGNFIFLD